MVSVVMLVLAQTAFERVDEIGGVTVEARAQPGSQFCELRLRAMSPASVSTLCDAAFGDGTVPKDDQWVRERKVLSASADERLTYERVRAPVVSDRDYVLKTARRRAQGRCSVQFAAVSGVVPESQGVVRLTVLRGEWRFEPRGDLTAVEYVSHSEPGGGVPAFLVEGPRRGTEVEVVRRLLSRVAKTTR